MYDKYRLKYGETLNDVAKRFNTNENFLKEIRALLSDKEKFMSTQKAYIKQLKDEGKI